MCLIKVKEFLLYPAFRGLVCLEIMKNMKERRCKLNQNESKLKCQEIMKTDVKDVN